MLSAVESAVPEPPAETAADDGWLIARAKRGDRAAFAQLVAANYDFIFRVAAKWSGRRGEAEDIAQEVCVKLASVLGQFDGRSAFTSWLYRVTLNVVRDHQRAAGRRGRHLDALAEVSTEALPPDQEDAVAARELWDAVKRLPNQQRDAVLLVYAEDLNHASAAEILGCKEATVSWHIHEAKKTLKGFLRGAR